MTVDEDRNPQLDVVWYAIARDFMYEARRFDLDQRHIVYNVLFGKGTYVCKRKIA